MIIYSFLFWIFKMPFRPPVEKNKNMAFECVQKLLQSFCSMLILQHVTNKEQFYSEDDFLIGNQFFSSFSLGTKRKRKLYLLYTNIFVYSYFLGLLTMTTFCQKDKPYPGDFFSLTFLDHFILYTHMSFCSGKTIRIHCAHDAITMIVLFFLHLHTASSSIHNMLEATV